MNVQDAIHDGVWPWLVMVASIIPFASFAWAVPAHFTRDRAIPAGMRYLSLFSLLSYVCFLVLLATGRAETTRLLTTIGIGGFAVAAALFWSAIAATRARRLSLAHSRTEPEFIQMAGPYAWIRHPFYTSYIIFWLGTGCIAGGWQWLLVSLLVAWYVTAARGEERRFQNSGLAARYEAYRGQAGMLFPRLRRR